MMSYLSLLVELKLFRKIKMCFLPVGHTHEDIDQATPPPMQAVAPWQHGHCCDPNQIVCTYATHNCASYG